MEFILLRERLHVLDLLFGWRRIELLTEVALCQLRLVACDLEVAAPAETLEIIKSVNTQESLDLFVQEVLVEIALRGDTSNLALTNFLN